MALLPSVIAEKDEVSCHGNATQNSKPCFRTSKDIVPKARETCVNLLNVKTVYDEINKESGGAYDLSSQRTTKHAASKSTKKGKNDQRNEYTGIFSKIINGNNAATF